jgi:hypothetical protein
MTMTFAKPLGKAFSMHSPHPSPKQRQSALVAILSAAVMLLCLMIAATSKALGEQ